MIPIRDDQPRFSTSYVNYFIVALNTVIFLVEFWIQLQSPRTLNGVIHEFGVIPHAVTGALTACGITPNSWITPFSVRGLCNWIQNSTKKMTVFRATIK